MRYPAERFCEYCLGFFITCICCVGVECSARRTLLSEWAGVFHHEDQSKSGVLRGAMAILCARLVDELCAGLKESAFLKLIYFGFWGFFCWFTRSNQNPPARSLLQSQSTHAVPAPITGRRHTCRAALVVYNASRRKAGGSLRTSTRPTLNHTKSALLYGHSP